MEADLKDLAELLHAECPYRMADKTMDTFLGLMTEIPLRNKEALIPYGKFDPNIYVVKSGIVRHTYFSGLKEITFGFSLPGTVVISFYPFYRRELSFLQIESCGASAVMKVSNANFDRLTRESNDFARWMLSIYEAQLWHNEKKLAVMNGSAKERFEALIKNRPEIMENVPLGIIASYIGITPSSLSRLKRQFKSS